MKFSWRFSIYSLHIVPFFLGFIHCQNHRFIVPGPMCCHSRFALKLLYPFYPCYVFFRIVVGSLMTLLSLLSLSSLFRCHNKQKKKTNLFFSVSLPIVLGRCFSLCLCLCLCINLDCPWLTFMNAFFAMSIFS